MNSIDYLLKPIEAAQLDRALDKIERMRGGAEPRPEIRKLLDRIAALAAGAAAPALSGPHCIAHRRARRVRGISASDALLRGATS